MAHKQKSHVPWWVMRSVGGWVLADIPRAAVTAYAIRYAPVPIARIGWATAAEYGPATGRLALRIGVIAYESSATVRSAATFGRFAGAVGVGYVAGAAIGTGIAYGMHGEKGAKDAVNLYTGGVGARQYLSTVRGALEQILEHPDYR